MKNGVPQGSVLAPLLFSVYTADLPHTRSKKYIYADDRLADYQLKVRCNGNIVPCESHPKYLGITLDRTLTYKNHLDQLSQKVSARNNLLRRLSGQTWGASFNVLQTSVVSLVYAPAEYSAPNWSHSTHTKKIDIALNSTMRIVSGCLSSTPAVDYLPVVSDIVPPDIRRSSHTLKAKANHNHLLHAITCNSDINPNLRLNTRKSFHTQRTQLNNTPTADAPNKWAETWHTRWQANSTHLHKYIITPEQTPSWTRPSSTLLGSSKSTTNRPRSLRTHDAEDGTSR